jgi:lactate dehydrogenase-like 2-hydroxyacid dehydrogenase
MNSRVKDLVVVAHGTQPRVLQELEDLYEVARLGSGPLREELLRLGRQEIVRAQVLVTPGGRETPGLALEGLPNLRLIACTGSGYDGLDLSYIRRSSIAVTRCPHVNAASVAEIAVALLIASMRGMCEANRILRESGFVKPWVASRGLSHCRAGIYGLGAIGTRVATRLVAMEMHIGYCARRPRSDVPYACFESLMSLAKWSDALIVCVAATGETTRSVDGSILSALGSQGHLVNVSRASIIDTEALCAHLERGTLAGAGLDVAEPEYLARLLALRSVTLTPHIGGSTEQAEAATRDLVVRNVAAYFAGEPLITPIAGDTRSQ